MSRHSPHYCFRLPIFIGILIAFGFNLTAMANPQESTDQIKTLQTLINGSTFETDSVGKLERYKYDNVRLERCSLIWTEAHEVRESNQRTLSELTEITVPLPSIDPKALRADKLKSSGFVVSMLTKGLEPGIVTRQRMQWGNDQPTESSGVATGTAFYFGDRVVAEKVSKELASLVSSCRKN